MNAIYFKDKSGMGSSRVILLGSIYLLLGIFALAFASATTLAAIITLGLVLMFVGIAEIVYGLQGRKRGQLWPHVCNQWCSLRYSRRFDLKIFSHLCLLDYWCFRRH